MSSQIEHICTVPPAVAGRVARVMVILASLASASANAQPSTRPAANPGPAAVDATPVQAAAAKAQSAASAAEQSASAAASSAQAASATLADLRKLIPRSESAVGDRLMIESAATGFKRLHTRAQSADSGAAAASAVATTVDHHAAPRTRLTVTQETDEHYTVRVWGSPCDGTRARLGAALWGGLPFTVPVGDTCARQPQVEIGESYQVERAALKKYGYWQAGYVYGALLLPYKYRFRGDNKGLDPSPTIGPYLGWRDRQGATGRSWVASAGLVSIRLADANGNQRTAHGMSWATGVMFDVSKSAQPFKSGLFIGRDYLGRNEPDFKGGLWLALQIGYDFSD